MMFSYLPSCSSLPPPRSSSSAGVGITGWALDISIRPSVSAGAPDPPTDMVTPLAFP